MERCVSDAAPCQLRRKSYAIALRVGPYIIARRYNYMPIPGAVDSDGHPLLYDQRSGTVISAPFAAGVNPNVQARVDVQQASIDQRTAANAATLALRQQAMQFANTYHEKMLVEHADASTLNDAVKTVQNDLTGKTTLDQAFSAVAMHAPRTTGVAPRSATQAATAAPAVVAPTPPPGSPAGTKLAPDGNWYAPAPNGGGWLKYQP
jgi:hypothetical protein